MFCDYVIEFYCNRSRPVIISSQKLLKSFKVRTVTQCLPFFSCNFASHIVLLKGASPGFYLYVIVSLCGSRLPAVYAPVMVKMYIHVHCVCVWVCSIIITGGYRGKEGGRERERERLREGEREREGERDKKILKNENR